MNGDLYGIIIYKTGFNTKAFSRHEVFQGLEGKIRGDLKDLAKNGGINLKADELIEKLKLLPLHQNLWAAFGSGNFPSA